MEEKHDLNHRLFGSKRRREEEEKNTRYIVLSLPVEKWTTTKKNRE